MRQILRWVMRIQGFDYTVQYRPGATNIADSLSRLSVTTSSPTSFDEATEVYVHSIMEIAKICALSIREIEGASKNDPEIQEVRSAIATEIWLEGLRKFKLINAELCF